jgi:putative DNA primase/helicase
MSKPQQTSAHVNGQVEQKLRLLATYFLNRTDRIAFLASWGTPSPADPEDQLDAILRAHVDATAPAVQLKWCTTNGKQGTQPGRHRIGTYNIAPGTNTTRWGGIDADGKTHKTPLATPLSAALTIIARLAKLNVPAYLERSGSGSGWHVWVFFDVLVPAVLVRRLLFGILAKPDDRFKLANGEPADPKAGKGLEVFPKQDSIGEAGLGNLLWLPWHHAATAGANEFYRVAADGNPQQYMPTEFKTITLNQLAAALAKVAPESSRSKTRDDQRDETTVAREALQHLADQRADDYQSWVNVGMALHNVGDDLLADWIDWSRQSQKFKEGDCEAKWRSFTREPGGITLGSLLAWAKDDTGWTPRRQQQRNKPATERDATATTGPSVWPDPQPIPADLPPVMPFDYDMLPEAFRGHVEDSALRMQCPPDFSAVAMMVTEAGVVGKKVGIRPKRNDDWLVIPNLWGTVIGRPGIMKTPAIRQPVKFLLRLQVEAQKQYKAELAEYENKRILAEIKKKTKVEEMKNAVKNKKDPLEIAKRYEVEEPKAPTPKRYLVNDSTVEKLGELLNQNRNGLTVFRDELVGLLRQLDKEGQEGARAFYLEAWDGLGKFTYDRIGRGTLDIDTVTLSILGGATPGRLLDYLGGAIKGGEDDDGTLQRYQLMVFPDVDRRWRNIDRWPDTQAKQRAWEVFQRLDKLDTRAIGAEAGDDDDGVPFLHFDQAAQRLFDDWRAKLEDLVRSGEEHPALESHLAKYRSLMPSLALLIHLADGGQGAVRQEAARKAIEWCAYLESHARRVYSVATNAAPIAAKALAAKIRKGELKDGFTMRDVYRKHWVGLSQKQAVEQAVDLLIELHWLREWVEETGGKQKVHFAINPALCAKTAPTPGAKSAKSPSAPPIGTSVTDPPGHFHADGQPGGEQDVFEVEL